MSGLVDVGTLPPVGEVPEQMYAQIVRQCRFGDPLHAFEREAVSVPEVGPRDVLIGVMAAGINFDNVWAARASPST